MEGRAGITETQRRKGRPELTDTWRYRGKSGAH